MVGIGLKNRMNEYSMLDHRIDSEAYRRLAAADTRDYLTIRRWGVPGPYEAAPEPRAARPVPKHITPRRLSTRARIRQARQSG